MKRIITIALLLAIGLCLSGCVGQTASPNLSQTADENDVTQATESEVSTEMDKEETTTPVSNTSEQTLALTIDGTTVDVSWENNDTVAELLAYAQNSPIVVNASEYGGFEQVGSLPQSFSRSDVQTRTQPGDIVLYSGNQIVVFFGSNSWSYTKLGHIEGLSADELNSLLDKDSIVIELRAES